MNLKQKVASLIDRGVEVRPWLLFAAAITIAAALTALVLVQSIHEGMFGAEVSNLSSDTFKVLGVKMSTNLPQALISLGLLNYRWLVSSLLHYINPSSLLYR